MSLFFYGSVTGDSDRVATVRFLRELGQRLAWNLRVDDQQTRDSLGLSSAAEDVVAFELGDSEDKDVYDQLYDEYSGDAMVKAYREAARRLHIPDWERIEFGASDVVDDYYREHPVDLPCIVFVTEVVRGLGRLSMFCFDEGNEGVSKLTRVRSDQHQVLMGAWMTIAFGYTWPSLCLMYDPELEQRRKHLKLMADYDSFPLWQTAPDNPANVDPQTLPLSAETRERLKRWAAAYDATLNRADPLASGFESAEAEAEFDRTGLELRRKVQEELGDGYRVTYYSYTQHQEL